MQNSGFKVLAIARFNQCEYSIILYLINCAVSGLDDLVTTKAELASLVGYDIPTSNAALTNLSERKTVRIKYTDLQVQRDEYTAMRIALNFEIERWKLNFPEDISVSDAIVFPFRRSARPLQLLEPTQKENRETWHRVVDSFMNLSGSDKLDVYDDALVSEAKVLVDTHPVDQVLLLLRHFGPRITNLSLLASSWNHYVEIFENETFKVDFAEARKKHQEHDQILQKRAREYLDQGLIKQLTSEEVSVLKIIINHRHPRRQLFWAYQARTRYPNLKMFFEGNEDLMLPVTSAGHLVKRPPKPDLSAD